MIKWEDPPPDGKKMPGERKWQEEADELRAHPGEWGLVAIVRGNDMRNANGQASGMKRGQYAAFKPPLTFDAVARKMTEDEEKVVKIYARYMGEHTSLCDPEGGCWKHHQ